MNKKQLQSTPKAPATPSRFSSVTRKLKDAKSFFKLDKAKAFFAGTNKAIFTPGIIRQALNALIGSKHNQAMQNSDSREFNRQKASARKDMLNLMQDELNKHQSLKSFASSDSFEQLIGKLHAELVTGQASEELYALATETQSFRRDIKIALFEVNTKINQLDSLNSANRQAYQENIMDLLYARKANPLKEFKTAYTEFTELELSDPEHPVLQNSYTRLADAQTALKALGASYDLRQPRSQEVVDFLQEHDCLSLRAIRETIRLKKIIATNKAVLKAARKIETAENLLKAFDIAHKSARAACQHLAIYAPIRAALAQRHNTNPALSTKALPDTQTSSKNQKVKTSWPEPLLPYLSLLETNPVNNEPVMQSPSATKNEGGNSHKKHKHNNN